MPELPSWTSILSRTMALRAASEEDLGIDYNQLVGEEIDTEAVAELMLVLAEIQTAAGVAKRAVEAELAKRMAAEERTSLHVAGHLVTWKPKSTTRVKDIDGFWEYMKQNPELLAPGFNPNNLRKTGIPQAVFDTFFETVPGVEPVIGTIPDHVLDKLRNQKERKT